MKYLITIMAAVIAAFIAGDIYPIWTLKWLAVLASVGCGLTLLYFLLNNDS